MMSQREVALTFIENLRVRKEKIKNSIAFLQNEIITIDIQIRDIRQHMPLKQKIPKRLTHEQKLQNKLDRLTKELDELRKVHNQ